MNLADLEKEFWGDQREQPTRVRLARVIRALRDQFDFTSRGKNWSEGEVHDFFTEILGGLDAEGEAAGGSTREDEQHSGETVTPATDAAPAVCVWAKPKDGASKPACLGFGLLTYAGQSNCQGCGRPITFKEANHG